MEEAAGSWRERERAGRRTSERRREGAAHGAEQRQPGPRLSLSRRAARAGASVPAPTRRGSARCSPCGGRRRRLSGPHGTARVLPPRPRSRRGRGALRAGPGARDRRAKEGREAAAAQATGRQRQRRHHVIPQSRQEADGHGRSQAH